MRILGFYWFFFCSNEAVGIGNGGSSKTVWKLNGWAIIWTDDMVQCLGYADVWTSLSVATKMAGYDRIAGSDPNLEVITFISFKRKAYSKQDFEWIKNTTSSTHLTHRRTNTMFTTHHKSAFNVNEKRIQTPPRNGLAFLWLWVYDSNDICIEMLWKRFHSTRTTFSSLALCFCVKIVKDRVDNKWERYWDRHKEMNEMRL